MADKTVALKIGDSEKSYPVLSGSVGPDVIDIRKLYGETGAFTYDPGFTSTASCESKITYRSEEHTSELQSLMRISYAVFCLKKKKLIYPHEKATLRLNTTTAQHAHTYIDE